MKKIILVSLVIISIIMAVCFIDDIPTSQAIFDINLTVRNGTAFVNDKKIAGIERIATFSGMPYVPLNLAAKDLGIDYSKNTNGSVVNFVYKNNKMTINFSKKVIEVNGVPYTLLHGVAKRDISGVSHIFLGAKDIQNIFGIIVDYDESNFTVKMDTGFGVVKVDYSEAGGYQTESNMINGKTKLLSYANTIAGAIKGSIKESNKTEIDSVVAPVVDSINSQITLNEFNKGMQVSGVSYKTTSQNNISYIKDIKFISSLSNITVGSEYVGVYNISTRQSSELYVAGLFLTYEGLDVSDEDLAIAAIATIEDTTGKVVSRAKEKEIFSKIKTIANKLRKENKILVVVIKDKIISIVTLI